MKHSIFKIGIIFLSLLYWGCSNDDSDLVDGSQVEQEYARFLQKKLTVSGMAGEVMVTIEWSGTNWEITWEPGNLVTEVSQTLGGKAEDVKQNMRVKITYSTNPDLMSRSQTIHITNKLTGQVSDLLIEQTAIYKDVTANVDMNTRYQHVAGFGGMYNPVIWCGSYLITTNEMNKMYGPGGLGYSILRLMIYPNENDWTADVEAAKLAQQNGAIIFACPWDCTDALADKLSDKKHLKHENYEAYAQHLIKYIGFMKSHGVNLYAVSMQNEPDMEFTYWTPAEVVDFVKRFGPAIRETGVKLMSPEACGTSPEYTDPILNDAEAFANTDILAGHLYQGFINLDASYDRNRHDYISGLYNRLQGKTWWMTEHLFNDGEKETDPSKWEFQQWSYNLSHVGKEIHMCMEGYCSAYVYWYLKRFYGMMGDNDNRSLVASGEIAKNGYILSHYAKYATGKTRIKVELGNPNVQATAYVNEEGNEVTLVLLNMTDDFLNVQIPLANVKEVNAVETSEDKNMNPATTGRMESGGGVYVLLSKRAITSVRLAL